MKSYNFKGILLSSAIAVSMMACSSKDEPLEVAINAKTLAGKYKLTSLTAETAVSPPADAMGKLDACERDNIFELRADSTASYIDAGVLCEPPLNYDLDYEINNTSVSLTGFQNDYFTGGTVTKFDTKTLVLEVKTKYMGIDVTIVGTFTRQ